MQDIGNRLWGYYGVHSGEGTEQITDASYWRSAYMDIFDNLSESQREAAEELKSHINAYGKTVLGHTRGFAHMYVGTIHGFCIRML